MDTRGTTAEISGPVAAGKPVIRPVRFEDLPACVAMIVQLRNETYWRNIEGDSQVDVMSLSIAHRLATNANVCLFVAELDGKLIGLCGGEIVSHWLAPQVSLLGEWAWWVVETHRKGSVGARLWLSVVAWAKERGVRYGGRNKVESAERHGSILGIETFTMKEL